MAKKKILIIDDERDVREVIMIHLAQAGYQFLEAGNGEEAIHILQEGDNRGRVGLILCDIRMPKVNGLNCIDFILKEAPATPVVVITAAPDEDLSEYLIGKGVKDYLVKPVSKSKLIETVNRFIAP
ncbi:MAG: response regulator [Nitrospinaceae bacterium]